MKKFKERNVKRVAVTRQDAVDTLNLIPKAGDEVEYSVIVNGLVEVSMCPDTGADCSIVPKSVMQRLEERKLVVHKTQLQPPLIVRVAGGSTMECRQQVLLDLQIRTTAGPVNLYGVECLVMEGDEDQILLGKDVMKRLGIDIKRTFELLANSTIQLNNDDLPEPAGLDEVAMDEVGQQLDRMITEMLPQLGGLSAVSTTQLVSLHKEYCQRRTQLGPDPPAKVEPLRVTLIDGAQPVRCKPHRYPPAQHKFLQEHVEQLLRFGFIRKNNQSKWASNAVPVRKPDDPTSFRITNNYIPVNALTIPVAGTMPHFSVILSYVQGAQYFAKFDMFKGFWQIALAPECQEYFSFMKYDGVYTPLRVPQGATDSALHFQNQMQTVYEELLYKCLLLWIDDVIVYAKTIGEFVANLTRFYQLTAAHGLKLNAKKSVLFCKEVEFCGRIIDGTGIRQDESRLSGLTTLPLPATGADLQRFLCASNWIRDSIVDYARVFEPLQSKFNDALQNKSRKKKSAAACVLTWDDEERKSYAIALRAIANSAKLYFPDDAATICLFTDASDLGWAIVVTQVLDWKEGTPVVDQQHELLICHGGAFRGAELHWSVVEKEGYPFVRACIQLDYLLERGRGFKAFCDHSNLIQIFSPTDGVKKHTRGKLLRWALRISNLRYTIEHLEGTSNVWADIVSRWTHNSNATARQGTVQAKTARISQLRPLQD